MHSALGKLGQVEVFNDDATGRLIGMCTRGAFADYESFPPFVTTEQEVAHLQQAYTMSNPLRERHTKAHLTADELPIQIVILAREKGSTVKPHYHLNNVQPESATRHQIMYCERGVARIGLYTREGRFVGDVHLHQHDFVLMCEGHSIEFVEENTKLIEFKMGPFPETDAEDKIDLEAPMPPG